MNWFEENTFVRPGHFHNMAKSLIATINPIGRHKGETEPIIKRLDKKKKLSPYFSYGILKQEQLYLKPPLRNLF